MSLPERVDGPTGPLVLNGMGIRRASFLKVHVYVAGLYLPQPTRDVTTILQPSTSKQLTLHFVRNVSHGEMTSAIKDGLEDNATPAQAEAAKVHVQNLERMLPELRDGTVLTLTYQPQHGLRVVADGVAVGTEPDDTFANLLFQVWLGPKPPDSGLKAGLLGQACD